ncbi:[NiFe]-hydrogenase assembly chaperone HybE [Nitrogeniibacter mangrovi]|uniref:[NiFe]-hydrogenase assembly chaperone HybE n=1 Tax=Nitrogeniibacter mangrovi TaxID=2016596 RepID=A0A6C1B3F7_9RHOO|nr:[NiFe]-hydrogenase assembly chaperone HybE [Nitrogeniibacter mangrovi]QID16860.1 [NiFe]-hydrogenase assembly chaperone HybE [Nitrogeniibacter mangrovi]
MGTPATVFADDPSAPVQAAFARIGRERMREVPLCHAGLSVETVGFTHWDGLWVGVLITPWAMNLMVLPGGSAAFAPVRVGHTVEWAFPSGAYAFMGHQEDGLGEYHYCPLFSPMEAFEDQAAARAVAEEVMQSLFAAPVAPATAPGGMDRRAFFRRALGRGAPA